MRAATVIVGAIAAASILVAMAFILSPGGSTAGGTTTIEKIVEAPEESGTNAAGQAGGPTRCGKEFSVEDTSCEIGEAIHRSYDGGHRGLFTVKDPQTGEYLEFNCGEPTPVICTQSGGAATVSFGA
jgi:hypothetical protein